MQNFHLEGGPVAFAARTAHVIVNPTENTFQFEMWDVVMTRIPEKPGDEAPNALQKIDRYVVGPLPYPVDIVVDEGTGRELLTLESE